MRRLFQQWREREVGLREEALQLRELNGCRSGRLAPSEIEAEQLISRGILTKRETEVWIKLAQGLTNAQIADALQISTETVRKHVGQVLKKLGVENRTSAARKAYDRSVPLPAGT